LVDEFGVDQGGQVGVVDEPADQVRPESRADGGRGVQRSFGCASRRSTRAAMVAQVTAP
jgi:hypothetical protein